LRNVFHLWLTSTCILSLCWDATQWNGKREAHLIQKSAGCVRRWTLHIKPFTCILQVLVGLLRFQVIWKLDLSIRSFLKALNHGNSPGLQQVMLKSPKSLQVGNHRKPTHETIENIIKLKIPERGSEVNLNWRLVTSIWMTQDFIAPSYFLHHSCNISSADVQKE
jgi:hypothetical protein